MAGKNTCKTTEYRRWTKKEGGIMQLRMFDELLTNTSPGPLIQVVQRGVRIQEAVTKHNANSLTWRFTSEPSSPVGVSHKSQRRSMDVYRLRCRTRIPCRRYEISILLPFGMSKHGYIYFGAVTLTRWVPLTLNCLLSSTFTSSH